MMDLIAYVDSEPSAGETRLGTDFARYLGGKGFNQAVASARAGLPTSLVAMVGHDSFGDEFVHAADAEGLDTAFLFQTDGRGTGVGLPRVAADGSNSIVIVPRANSSLDPEHVQQADATIERASVLLLQLEISLEANLRAAKIASTCNTTVVLTPAPARPVADLAPLLRLTNILVPNEGELAQMLSRTAADVEADSERLRSMWNFDAVIVTCGGRGAYVCSKEGTGWISAPIVAAVDTVGAGDVFTGNLAAALAAGEGYVEAVHRATTAASESVTKRGGAVSAPGLQSASTPDSAES